MKKNKSGRLFFIFSSLSVLLLAAVLLSSGCLASDIPEITLTEDKTLQDLQNTINVSGEGTIKVVPDEASISLSVQTEKPTTQEAVDENSKITDSVIAAVESTAAENLKIETTGYELYPLYNYKNDNSPPEIYAYRVNSIMEARTTDLKKIGEIIAKATETGTTTITSIGFDLTGSTKAQAKKDALSEATRDASDKALAIAQSLGLKIQNILYISENSTSVPIVFKSTQGLGEVASQDVAAPSILPEEIEVTANISVGYLFTE